MLKVISLRAAIHTDCDISLKHQAEHKQASAGARSGNNLIIFELYLSFTLKVLLVRKCQLFLIFLSLGPEVSTIFDISFFRFFRYFQMEK